MASAGNASPQVDASLAQPREAQCEQAPAGDVSVARLEDLDPGNYFPLWLGSEVLRQNALDGLVASWGSRRPFYIRQNGILSLMCGRARDIREVYLDPERFTVEPPARPGYEMFDMFGGLESVLQMDGRRHSRVRRLMNPSFAPATLRGMAADIDRIVDEKLDRIERNGPQFDAVGDFGADLVQRIMLEGSFRLTREHCDVFSAMLAEMGKLPSYTAGEPIPQSFYEAGAAVRTAIDEIIALRRDDPVDDLISRLIAAREEGDRLSDAELFGQINSIATAGIGTTANTLAGALMLLARNRDALAAVRQDEAKLDGAIGECLRWHGPGIVAFVRFCTRDTQIGGTRVPRDMPVYVSAQAAGFDPDEVADPFRFDIARDNRQTLVFGTGPHHCIGQRLARQILRSALGRFIARFPDYRLADPEFRPCYHGLTGELSPVSIPMTTCR